MLDEYMDNYGDYIRDGSWFLGDAATGCSCRKCGITKKNEELFSGLCKDCLTQYVDPQTVKEYADGLVADCSEYVWESLFEEYFSEQDDRCQIERVSETLKDRLMNQIMREFNLDKLGDTFHSKEKLVAWIGEDAVAWDDFADWLVEKKGVLKT